MIEPGSVVFSKRGRDKGFPFIVLSIADDYVYLADGIIRRLDKPKKKKIKHIQPTRNIMDFSGIGGRGLQDADVRKFLEEVRSIVKGRCY